MIGFIIMAVIGIPIIILITASIFETPRTFRIPGLFLGSIILMVGGFIAAFAVLSILLKFIVPQ